MPTEEEKARHLDKVAMLKAKQGIDENSDSTDESAETGEKQSRYTELHGWEKVKNNLYYSRWFIIVGMLLIAIFGYGIYDLVTKEKADMRVIFLVAGDDPSSYMRVGDVELAVEKYLPDFNGDGNIHADVYFINVSDDQAPDLYTSGQTKFISEFNGEEGQLYLVDQTALDLMENLTRSKTYLTELTDKIDETSLTADKRNFPIKGTEFSKLINWEDTESIFLAVRNQGTGLTGNTSEKAIKNRENALEVLVNIAENNVVN